MAARARREVLAFLTDREAFDPARAVPFDFPSELHRRQLGNLVGRGIVRDTGDGRYWIDRAAVALDEQRRRDAARLLLKIVLVAAAVAIAAGLVLSLAR